MSKVHKHYSTLSLKVMVNKQKDKVLFAEADNHFVDILLSFLTLPLGRIIKVLDPKQDYSSWNYKLPTIGSLSSLYRSLGKLDKAHFVTEAANKTLLNPSSSFEDEHKRLKLDITDSPPTEYFYCSKCRKYNFGKSLNFDQIKNCDSCLRGYVEFKGVDHDPKGSQSVSNDGAFTTNKHSFIISDDLQILPNENGLLGIITILGITNMDMAEQIEVSIGFKEIVKLLEESLRSTTPLSDVLLKKTNKPKKIKKTKKITQTIRSSFVESQPIIVKEEADPNSSNLALKVILQKSTGKLLYAEAKEEFMQFLCSFSFIPLGGVVHLLAGNTCFKAINNLYRSTKDLIADEYFKSPDTRRKLMKPLPEWPFSYVNFPNVKESYLCPSRTYQVKDDLTVVPFCFVSIISSLKEQKIPVSDVKEVELQIGVKEALSILRASLSSTSALTDALLTRTTK